MNRVLAACASAAPLVAAPPPDSRNTRHPAAPGSNGVYSGSQALRARRAGERWVLDEDVRGSLTLDVR